LNPLTTIRPWLLAAGEQFGIREVHEIRWHDADNKPREMYCTWRIMGSEDEEGDGVFNLTTASGNDAASKFAESWLTTIQIDLYNSQNGIYELASMCAGLHHTTIKQLFEEKAALYSKTVTDQSTFDDERIDYHHRLVCVFRETIASSITETNGVVTTIQIQLDDGTFFDEYDVTSSGFTPTT
jgi:hypothetical protein